MCVSDWRLGRQIRSFAKIASTATGANIVTLPDRCRIGLTFSLTTGGINVINSMIVTFDNGAIIFITLGSAVQHFTMAQHGDLVTRGFTVSAGAVLTTLTIIEYSLPEEILAAGLNEFRRSLGLSL